jgi:hypothetical protein
MFRAVFRIPAAYFRLAMTGLDETYAARLEVALTSPDPLRCAHDLAVELRDSGMLQQQLLRIFDVVRARHENDADQSRKDAAVDVMDLIAGWCPPGKALYPQPPQTR